MKKLLLSALLLTAVSVAWAHAHKPQQEDPKAAKANEKSFQNQKEQEAKEKQEARRKAMKERAKTKEESEKTR